MILCFQWNLDEEVLVRGPLTSQEGLLGARMHSAARFISFFWMHKRAARVDLGSHGGVAFQRILRVTSVFVRKMNVLRF